MTLAEARAAIGEGVVYRPYPDAAPEDGTIVRVNDTYAFVLYRGDATAKATDPRDLTLLRRPRPSQ